MENDWSHMTEKILDLTLEIIYLLTGEEFTVVNRKFNSSTMKPPPSTPTSKKILEVTQKIIELLTGEVPIRCQDVTVYFSMEEWEYLEGHKDLYKDVMMEDEPDGSRKTNPPQRCPRPLEDLAIPQHDQVGEAEGHKDLYKNAMMEPPYDKNPPQRCPRPQDSQDSSQEDLPILNHDQVVDLKYLKIEVKEEEEETLVSEVWQSVEDGEMMVKTEQEETSLQMDADADVEKSPWEHPALSPYCNADDGIAHSSTRMNLIGQSPLYRPYPMDEPTFPCDSEQSPAKSYIIPADILRSHSASRSADPSDFKDLPLIHEGVYMGEHSLSSLECEKSLTEYITLLRQEGNNKRERPFSCLECGKSFITKGYLHKHKKIHTSERPYACAECGKSFIYNRDLLNHQRGHRGERCFSCTECGKSYIQKADLLNHQRVHTGRYPFSCSECGKLFHKKGKLIEHLRSHTGERPYLCTECKKGFFRKADLLTHQRIHTGERPFSCSECGKGFIKRAALVIHERVHTGERPFSCSECGKGFTHKGNLINHQKHSHAQADAIKNKLRT